MIVTYRLKSTNNYFPDEHRSRNEGVIKFIRNPDKVKPKRGANFHSECDWMVPNLRDPYAKSV